MYRLYDYLPSGNGYKVRLVLKHLGLAYELIEMDIRAGATRTPDYLAKNPNGRIPLLDVPGRGYLPESHAIISYLAEDSYLVPVDRYERAQMTSWMCFEQYNLEPNIGTARFWLRTLHQTPAELGARLDDKIARGTRALEVLERGLTGRDFLVAGRYTLADIALYAYTHVAPEGRIDLAPFPAIRHWIGVVESQPGWAPITSA